ncbi:MAG: C2 family cysteine protease, partial [Isosphaeraceae bacterium]
SGFTAGNPNAPQGSQVAFLQATGTISQVVNFAAAGSYLISASAAQRGNFGTSNEKVQVLVDGPVVGTITPASTRYATYTTASFNVTAGSHTITFVGVDPTGKDYTAFLDQVSIDIVSPTGDWFSRNMTDPGLQDLARWDFSRDSSLDYSDMLNLFAAAESGGSVTSAELQSLQVLVTIGGAAAVNMSGSVQSLTYKVVNGDPANAQFLGAPLGNLGVGSSATQLQHLVDKWFLGMDHPTIDMQYLSGRSVNYALASGTLFGNGGPSYKDVYQGMEGDCWLLASAAETAAIEPSVIQSMFTDDGTTLEGGVQVHIWTVRFYDHGVASYLTVDNALPAGNGNFVYANLSQSISSSSNVLWVPLLEKAYAQLCESGWNARLPSNAYASLNSGSASTSLPVITGAQESSSYPFGDASSFSSAISSGTLLTVGSITGNSSLGIVGNHDYAVLGYNASNQTFTLLNPWGWNNGAAPGILNLTWGQITQYFYLDGDCNPVSSVSLTAPAAPTFALGNQPRIRTVLAPTAGSPDSSWFTGTLLVGTGLTGPRPSGTIASERGLAAQLQALQPQVAILLDSEPMMPDSDPFELKTAVDGGQVETTVIEPVTCLVCGCLCDDIAVVKQGENTTAAGNACVLGTEWLLRDRSLEHGRPAALVKGQPVEAAEAVEVAARLLRNSPFAYSKHA